MNFYIGAGKTSYKDILDIVKFGQNKLYWDEFGEKWSALQNPVAVLEAFSREQEFFQADFKILIETYTKQVTIVYQAENHLYHFLKDAGLEVKRFLTNYRKATLENLLQTTLGASFEIVPVSDNTSSLDGRFHLHS